MRRLVFNCTAACLAALLGTTAQVADQHPQTRDVRVYAASEFTRYAHSDGRYSIEHPSDWKPHEQPTRTNIGSDAGLVPSERGGFRTVYGAIIAVVDDPAAGGPDRSLAASTTAIIQGILTRNPHQSLRESVAQDGLLAGSPVFRGVMFGTSPVTGKPERAEVLCRRIDATRLLYIILVSPGESYEQLKPTFLRMRNSLALPAATR